MKNRIEQLEVSLNKEKSEIDSINGQIKYIEKTITDTESKLKNLKKEEELNKKSVELLQLVQKSTREVTKQRFESIVTHALKSVFQKDLKLKLTFGRRGNLPTLDFNICTNDKDEYIDLIDSESGGVINIVSLALRLVLLEMSIPKVEGTILLDERLNNVSKEYLEPTMVFLKEINNKLNRQIILISHNKDICDIVDANNIRIENV